MTFTALVRISLVFIIVFAVASCRPCIKGEGRIEQESAPIDSFSVVVVKGSMDVFLSQNFYPRTVTIKAQPNIIDLIDVYVRNHELIIESEECFHTDENIEVYVNSNVFEGIKVQGSGDVQGMTDFRGSSLDIQVNGSGDVTAEVHYRLVSVGINGSGDVGLTGKTNRMEVAINGSGDVTAPNMTCHSTSVSINGSGDVYVNADHFMEVTVNGSGDVRYTGFPTDTSFTVRGSGSIRSAY